jgi:CheY-like chemotaxis protein
VKRIVYVEDNEDNVFMLQTRLELEGDFELLVAVNGNDGLEMVGNERPDVVLMDLNLPDISGWEVTRRLKADPATAAIPVIALTAHAMSGDREKALAAGCDEFDTKPIDFDRLLRKIDALLDNPT